MSVWATIWDSSRCFLHQESLWHKKLSISISRYRRKVFEICSVFEMFAVRKVSTFYASVSWTLLWLVFFSEWPTFRKVDRSQNTSDWEVNMVRIVPRDASRAKKVKTLCSKYLSEPRSALKEENSWWIWIIWETWYRWIGILKLVYLLLSNVFVKLQFVWMVNPRFCTVIFCAIEICEFSNLEFSHYVQKKFKISKNAFKFSTFLNLHLTKLQRKFRLRPQFFHYNIIAINKMNYWHFLQCKVIRSDEFYLWSLLRRLPEVVEEEALIASTCQRKAPPECSNSFSNWLQMLALLGSPMPANLLCFVRF